MCGIVGVLNLEDRPPVAETTLRQMLGMIRHRGPDEFGIYRDANAGLGSARLSIIDLSGGQQPIANEDETLWIVFNGEIFNYIELRPDLEARGHRFRTQCDTEIILHLYEEYGPDCLRFLNGQFAIAIWDARQRSLFLARDRVGVRPLFYTIQDGRLIFGSEIKAILAHPGARAAIDPVALEQIFTFWSPLSPRSAFVGIQDVPPAHYMIVHEGQIKAAPYWALDFTAERAGQRSAGEYLEEFEVLLIDATRIRLRADVPVGAYLSGGLDSSTTTAVIRSYTHNRLDTFSIAFADVEFDESAFQKQMACFLGTDHHVVTCTHEDIGRVFPDVIWHTETPILRTSPAPMYLLSRLVRDHGFKVVITGEGADEFLAGYDIFKEMKIRRFWAKQPQSQMRPLLLRTLYPDIERVSRSGDAFLAAFFGKGLSDTASPFYSHLLRWTNTARARRFLAVNTHPIEDHINQIPLPAAFARWSHLGQAQYLEVTTFLSQYLLSSQGDRPAMAHSVEGRFPFLDYRVIEFANRLPPELKLRRLTEKWLLKQLGRKLVPSDIWRRPKRPYRAPIHRSFFGLQRPGYVRELLAEPALARSGLFNVAAASQLARKAESGARLSEVEDMALVGILSTQLVYQQFCQGFALAPAVGDGDRIKIIERF